MQNKIRIGIGYDIHRLAPGRQLKLGGITIPSAQGLIGWSDADILTHAIIDALLGAAALGDIGTYFPSGDPKYKEISSLILLRQVTDMLGKRGYRVSNVDATIVAEQPRLRDYIDKMRDKLSQTMGINLDQVNVKANTSEQLGFAGRQEGMVTWATALIEEISD